MPAHKFKPCQIVLFETSLSQNIRGGAYMITKQMPERDGECGGAHVPACGRGLREKH